MANEINLKEVISAWLTSVYGALCMRNNLRVELSVIHSVGETQMKQQTVHSSGDGREIPGICLISWEDIFVGGGALALGD